MSIVEDVMGARRHILRQMGKPEKLYMGRAMRDEFFKSLGRQDVHENWATHFMGMEIVIEPDERAKDAIAIGWRFNSDIPPEQLHMIRKATVNLPERIER